MGIKNDRRSVADGMMADLIFLRDGFLINVARNVDKEKNIRVQSSMTTGTLKVKAKPRSSPEKKSDLRLVGL